MSDDSLRRLQKPLAALTEWLDATNVRGAIIGGVAASLRGQPRLTRDIDAVIVDASPETLLATSARFGFSPRIPDAEEFAHQTRVLLLRFTEGKIDVDVLLGGSRFEAELIERASPVDLEGIELRVAQPEDLIVMKAIARRPRDISDIESLLAANENLDVDRIRRWIREFASVLEMPEIQEDLEALLRARRR